VRFQKLLSLKCDCYRIRHILSFISSAIAPLKNIKPNMESVQFIWVYAIIFLVPQSRYKCWKEVLSRKFRKPCFVIKNDSNQVESITHDRSMHSQHFIFYTSCIIEPYFRRYWEKPQKWGSFSVGCRNTKMNPNRTNPFREWTIHI
jgi:hypothetical protein